MAGLAFAVAVLVAGVLTLSAATKTAHPHLAAKALVELGFATALARAAVVASIAWELGIASALAFWPGAVATQAASIALLVAFAGVALLGRRQGGAIDCGCFGALNRTRLGWLQIVEAAVAALAVLFVGNFAPSGDTQRGVVILAAAGVSVGVLLLVLLIREWFPVRRERRSLGSVVAHLGAVPVSGSTATTSALGTR